jgi:hypothetical protein
MFSRPLHSRRRISKTAPPKRMRRSARMPQLFVPGQGLPRDAARGLRDLGYECVHVGEIGMSMASGEEIVRFAPGRTAVVVTLDVCALRKSPNCIRFAATRLERELKPGSLVTVMSGRGNPPATSCRSAVPDEPPGAEGAFIDSDLPEPDFRAVSPQPELLTSGAFNRPISAYLSGVSRVRASQTILVSRLARRFRRRREAPSGNVRRNISRTCCAAWSASTSPGRSARLEFDCFGWGTRCRGWERAC